MHQISDTRSSGLFSVAPLALGPYSPPSLTASDDTPLGPLSRTSRPTPKEAGSLRPAFPPLPRVIARRGKFPVDKLTSDEDNERSRP